MVGEEQKMAEQEQLKKSLRGEKTKELIIDGINVNECEFYGYDGICKLYSGSICSKDCSNYPNCNYKQLKRKEQECEKLQKENEEWQKKLDKIEKEKTNE